ncbi:MAG: peptidase [Microcystaceae cyanobacterium]
MTAKPFSQMLRVFRKYHRWLAIILCLPLLLTVMTGMAYTVLVDWFGNTDAIEILLGLHTLEIVHLEKFYPPPERLRSGGIIGNRGQYDRIV